MKKKFLIAMLAVMMGVLTAGASEPVVSKVVLESFKKEFPKASEVSWTSRDNYFRAEFRMNTLHVFAYFSFDGELKATARYISSLQLPLNLMSSLKNDYQDYWITDLFEVNKKDGTFYYVTIENADVKLMLKASNGGEWALYNKKNKD